MDLDKTGFKSCLNICSFLDNVKHQYDGVFFVGERGSGDGNLDLLGQSDRLIIFRDAPCGHLQLTADIFPFILREPAQKGNRVIITGFSP